MSRYHGAYYKGAAADNKIEKRGEADDRRAAAEAKALAVAEDSEQES